MDFQDMDFEDIGFENTAPSSAPGI